MKTIQVSVATDGYCIDNIIIHAPIDSDIVFSDELDRANTDYLESLLPSRYQGRGNMIISLNYVQDFVLVGGEIVTG